jgi:hypothetical protein
VEQGVVNLIQAAIDFLNNCFADMRIHLQTTPDTFAGGAPWSAVTAINSAIQGVGYGLLVLFFLMSFFKTTSNFKEISLQQCIGWIVRFILAKVLIDYGIQILNFFISIAMGVNSEIFANAGSFEFAQVPQEVLDVVAQMEGAAWYERIGSFFQTIPMFIVGGISMLAIWVCGVIMIVTVYLRFFKLFIMSAIAPLPLATFGSSETSGTGKHFLKAYAAVCLEICVVALAIIIFNAVAGSGDFIFPSWGDNNSSINAEFWDTMMNYLFKIVLQTVLLTVTVTSSSKIIKEVIGV